VLVVQKFPVIRVWSLNMSCGSLRDGPEFFQPGLPSAAWQKLRAFPQRFAPYARHGLPVLPGDGDLRVFDVA
jgi:hypothetical protein